ncbi:hypothetical protein [Methylobacterium oryzihabitans]|nr:hypothetical protein [Methylobacterium oryzihabitans]
MVITGPDMAEGAIRAALDPCLVGSVTTGLTKAQQCLDDPFPVWGS